MKPRFQGRRVDETIQTKFLTELGDRLNAQSTQKYYCKLQLKPFPRPHLLGYCKGLGYKLEKLGWKRLHFSTMTGAEYYARADNTWLIRNQWKGTCTLTLEGDQIMENSSMNKIQLAYTSALARLELANAFDPNDAEQVASTIRSGLLSFLPFVSVQVSTIGGAHRPSIMITFSLEPKAEWVNGILNNSNYAKMGLHVDGTLEHFSGRLGAVKFRKSKVKDVQSVIKKIKEWVEKNGGAK